MAEPKNIKICSEGHKYYKSNDCPTCPICEQERKPKDGFLSLIPAPARRALENKGIFTLDELAQFTEKRDLKAAWHGAWIYAKIKEGIRRCRPLLWK